MKKLNVLLTTTFSFLLIGNSAISADKKYMAVDEFSKKQFDLRAGSYFKTEDLPNRDVNLDEKNLLKVITNTREYFTKHSIEDPVVNREGVLGSIGVKLQDVLNTLDYMAQILKEDISAKRETRLKDSNFINKNFSVIRWSPFNPKNRSQDKIRITKYAIFTHEGSKVKTNKLNVPLYGLKVPDSDTFYKKYTKQDVLSGIFDEGGKEYGKAEPIVYLTREGLEEALMEGTLLVNFPDGSSKYYNVDKNNGIAYVKGLNPMEQKRYWFFKHVDAINGYGSKIENRIKIEPGVTFAGDVFNVGLGKIVVIDYKISGERKLKMGIVADTGGAFLPNLHQLDFLAGIFKDRPEFYEFSKSLPEYADVYILIKK